LEKLNRDSLDVPVIIAVGAAFDFVAGVKSQAPTWVQKAGVEWLFSAHAGTAAAVETVFDRQQPVYLLFT